MSEESDDPDEVDHESEVDGARTDRTPDDRESGSADADSEGDADGTDSEADPDGADSDGTTPTDGDAKTGRKTSGRARDKGGSKDDPPLCRHGVPRRWLEKPEPYGWRGWFCTADVPDDELCLPIFVGRAHQYDRRHRLRWRGRRNR
jgi:hypothetical protein